VKKFTFRLESLREWRTFEQEREEERMRQLFREGQELDSAAGALEEAAREADLFVRQGGLFSGEWQTLSSFRRHVSAERQRLGQARAALETRIDSQRRSLVEANRKVEVLNRLKADKREQWRQQLDKEQEETVAELVVARWRSAT